MNYSWPGNVRELEHTVEHAFILAEHSIITLDDLPEELLDFLPPKIKKSRKKKEEPLLIEEALKKSGWNKAKAARLLGIDRKTIYYKIKKYNISKEM